MSIQTQIDRLNANVTAALNAIKAKGVTIPSGANSDNLATLIAAIQATSTTVSCTINGAPGETISYSGAKLGSVTLDSSGTATVSNLPVGSYTFTGSISGYSKSVSVTASQAINVWPNGKIIYWYGRFGTGFDAAGVNIASSKPLTKETNHLYSDTASKYWGALYFTPTVLRGSYTKLRVDAKMHASSSQSAVGLYTSYGAGNPVTNSAVAYANGVGDEVRGILTVDLSSVSSSIYYYVKAHAYGDIYVYAAWME
jgi:hypothetical protein